MKSEVVILIVVGKEVMFVGIGDKIRGIFYRIYFD